MKLWKEGTPRRTGSHQIDFEPLEERSLLSAFAPSSGARLTSLDRIPTAAVENMGGETTFERRVLRAESRRETVGTEARSIESWSRGLKNHLDVDWSIRTGGLSPLGRTTDHGSSVLESDEPGENRVAVFVAQADSGNFYVTWGLKTTRDSQPVWTSMNPWILSTGPFRVWTRPTEAESGCST